MKTVFINGSPKKKFSASAYFIGVQRCFVKGQKVTEKLRGKGDYERILHTLKDADNVIFCLPLYVDGVPSHVLAFMKEMEAFCHENRMSLNVYAISNGGFIEGNQSGPLMRVFENFCDRSGLRWGGGVGVGGGVMLNVMRILFFVEVALLLLNVVLSGAQTGNWLPVDALQSFLINTLLIVFFNLGVFGYALRMGIAVSKGEPSGERYTRILIPSFVFILFADIFFVVISIVEGGMFKGWLRKK